MTAEIVNHGALENPQSGGTAVRAVNEGPEQGEDAAPDAVEAAGSGMA
jgi:hypothetical protein